MEEFRDDEQEESFPDEKTPMSRQRFFLAGVLFLLTILTTTIVGAFLEGADPFHHPIEIYRGWPFSAALLVILLTHEFGHYIAARAHRVVTTLPIFVPGPPIPPLPGTFGAIIRIKSPITTKSALVDIGASGPLAGFVVALVVTAIGLSYSVFIPISKAPGSMHLGTSLIFEFLSYLVKGPAPAGAEVLLNPIAYAGWFGMLVTALNLLPIGQLDGGHIMYALLGPRHKLFSAFMVGVLIILAFATGWMGWMVWAVLISAFSLFVGMWHPPVEDQDIPLDNKRKAVSVCAMVVFVLTFMPTPFYIV